MNLEDKIRSIKDFPKEGIIFRDITTLLKDGDALYESIDQIEKSVEDLKFDIIIGPESRGFIFGVPLAYKMRKGFVPVRKAGKLPHKVVSQSYELEYGTATIEIHEDAILPGQRVLIEDHLLATGGTAKAIVKLIEKMGGEVAGFSFLIELNGLGGKKILKTMKLEVYFKFD